ncbi:MAG: hypothetical protein CL561_01705 [Alphaproteobacteria bacterium]|nr:hypothetical protein [Alphaproteobacteria bacterium]|tara:strand:+ start:49 stop:888 length:840 start_codon:yes stop_codon:yes gene_type:complete
MQFDINRAFPYPVLRPDVDDYIDGDMQAIIEFVSSSNGKNVVAKIKFDLSIPQLKELIKTNYAQYSMVFECRDTYYRKAILCSEDEFEVEFEEGELRGEVQAKPYIIAIKDIKEYECSFINPEFGLKKFSFDEGSVLAVDRPYCVYIDKDVFKPLSSVFTLISEENVKGYEWQIRLQDDYVHIVVSKDLKSTIDLARNTKKNKAVLINSIYFAAVVQCLSSLKNMPGEYDSFRWAEVVKEKCFNLGLDLEKEHEYQIAQKLMKMPFSMIDAHVFNMEQD